MIASRTLRALSRSLIAAVAAGGVALLASCTSDPVYHDAVKALGKESPGGPSEFHRAGQPCGLCHQDGGDASTDFAIAGTIFAGEANLIGVEGARVDLVDANGTSPPLTKPVLTNCVGNFFVQRSDWNPAFPIAVRVTKGAVSRTMRSQVSRASSCADCHVAKLPLDDPFSQVTHVFLFADQDPQGKAVACAIDPDLGAGQ
jgi:hypothetical protein